MKPHPDDVMIWPDGTCATREEIERGECAHKSDDYRLAEDWEANEAGYYTSEQVAVLNEMRAKGDL